MGTEHGDGEVVTPGHGVGALGMNGDVWGQDGDSADTWE